MSLALQDLLDKYVRQSAFLFTITEEEIERIVQAMRQARLQLFASDKHSPQTSLFELADARPRSPPIPQPQRRNSFDEWESSMAGTALSLSGERAGGTQAI